MVSINQRRRAAASAEYSAYWATATRRGPATTRGRRPALPYKTIDEFINASLTAENVAAAPLCDDHAFLRRIYLDIIGITPTAAQVAAFV